MHNSMRAFVMLMHLGYRAFQLNLNLNNAIKWKKEKMQQNKMKNKRTSHFNNLPPSWLAIVTLL